MQNNEKVVYIYNPHQAYFYIQSGVQPLATGINHKTNKVWFKFGFNETTDVYSKWCTRIR